ncbi:hypothetical protein [Streptacidiphilus neutrinimicus]|uniref:hypothetical protein n=1 Tax=Streptacidiphilus neutrinimicus TaxID=105420 RepID=UPI0005A830EA|nr:hypothetical protein [Streptacidiphilus neutrinimicus]
MRTSAPSWLPAPIARLLGYTPAVTSRADLMEQLLQAHAAAWAEQAQCAAQAPAMRTLIQFQPGLLAEVSNAAETAAYLNHLAGLAEQQLPRGGEMERALYQRVLAAARTAERLEQDLAAAATYTLPKDQDATAATVC